MKVLHDNVLSWQHWHRRHSFSIILALSFRKRFYSSSFSWIVLIGFLFFNVRHWLIWMYHWHQYLTYFVAALFTFCWQTFRVIFLIICCSNHTVLWSNIFFKSLDSMYSHYISWKASWSLTSLFTMFRTISFWLFHCPIFFTSGTWCGHTELFYRRVIFGASLLRSFQYSDQYFIASPNGLLTVFMDISVWFKVARELMSDRERFGPLLSVWRRRCFMHSLFGVMTFSICEHVLDRFGCIGSYLETLSVSDRSDILLLTHWWAFFLAFHAIPVIKLWIWYALNVWYQPFWRFTLRFSALRHFGTDIQPFIACTFHTFSCRFGVYWTGSFL